MGKDEFDDFEFSLKPRRASYSPAPTRDTESVDLSVCVTDRESDKNGDFRIPSQQEASRQSTRATSFRTSEYKSHGAAYDRVSISRKAEKKSKDSAPPETEYALPGPMLTYAEVRSWPEGYDFYGKFAADARESFARTKQLLLKQRDERKVPPCVPYFAYIPQFKQLNPAQWDYYLYMKDRLMSGVCLPDTDLSYILLFIYELINTEDMTGAADGAGLLARIWMLYRRYHPELDKYMSEWMADYCIVYRVPLPEVLISDICDICERSTFKEFYADAARAFDSAHGTGYFPRIVRACLSDYSPRRSRYADKIEDFEDKAGAVFDAALREDMISGSGLFEPSRQRDVKISRDVFCGSLCSSNIKKRITLTLCTFMRSPESRRTVTDMMKGAENTVRARHGIKARLSAPRLDAGLRGRSAEVSAVSEEERNYLKYYDSQSVPLTHEAAAQIEEISWKNTDILTDGEFSDESDENNEGFEEVSGAITSDGFDDANEASDVTPQSDDSEYIDEAEDEAEDGEESLMSVLESRSPLLAGAVRRALEGGSFSEYCREAGLFADSAASEINEAADEIIGDIVLEMSGGDYRIVEDYRDEIDL